MNESQDALAAAYAHVFAPGPQTQIVMDHMMSWANSLTEPLVKAGAIMAVGHLYQMASLKRRAKAREK